MRKLTTIALGALMLVGMLSAVAVAQESDTETTEVPERVSIFDTTLDELVSEGVITQDQADTIGERLAAAKEAFRGSRVRHLDTVAGILEMDVDELRTALQGGSTIADVAGAQVQDVIDALVAEHQARLDQAVADGRIGADAAAERAAELEQHVTDMVNGELAERGPGFGRRGHGRHGFGGGFGPGADTAPEAVDTSA